MSCKFEFKQSQSNKAHSIIMILRVVSSIPQNPWLDWEMCPPHEGDGDGASLEEVWGWSCLSCECQMTTMQEM